jgi:hypothetical protein
MTATKESAREIAQRVARERAEQGLPPRVTDPRALRLIAGLVVHAKKAAGHAP